MTANQHGTTLLERCRCTCTADGDPRVHRCDLVTGHDGYHRGDGLSWPNIIVTGPDQRLRPWWQRTYEIERWIIWLLVSGAILHAVATVLGWLS